MENNPLVSAAEALLFASGEAVAAEKIAEVLEIDLSRATEVITGLQLEYETRQSGIRIVCMAGNYQMVTQAEHAGHIRRLLEIRRNTPLSPAALEVLAVVAYNQPVTKAFVEQVRGVDCAWVISSLYEKRLLEERGRLELPGRPLLYGTTVDFLRCFGLSSLEELPALPDTSGDTPDELQVSGE